MRLEGIITAREAPSGVLLARMRVHTGITEFALDGGRRSSFRQIQATSTDDTDCANLMIVQ
jgi:hypothetical protein